MRTLLIGSLAACAPVVFDDVAPVVEARCLGCHGQASALPLDDPASWTRWSAVARAAVADRTMPPWLPSDRGVPLQGSLALDRAERRLLLDWLDAGASHPPNAQFDTPQRPSLGADLRLAWPDHDVAGEQDRCFLVELPEASMTGFDVQFEGPVHHALLGVWPGSARGTLQAWDQADPAPGWSCAELFMGRREPVADRVPVVWFPSPAPSWTWAGAGVPLGGLGVLQVHGLGHGRARGALLLRTATDVVEEHSLALGTGDVPLTGGGGEVVVERHGRVRRWLPDGLGDRAVQLVGARGHGHERMTSLRITLEDRVLLDLPRWDPAHQARFTFAQAVQTDGDALLSLRCTYDDGPGDGGYGPEGEMCGAWVYATVDGAE